MKTVCPIVPENFDTSRTFFCCIIFCPKISFYAPLRAAESPSRPWHVTMKHFVFPVTRSQSKASLFLQLSRLKALDIKLFMCIYSYYVPTCGAFSIVLKTTMLKCVWPTYVCNITLEFEYLNQRFAINGALFSPKNNISLSVYLFIILSLL